MRPGVVEPAQNAGGPARAGAVRMLASDLDGTLLRSDNTVSDRTRAALHAAEDAGFVVAFVTGRPPRWLHEVADATGHTGVAVAANGALLYDLHTETIVREHLIDVETLARVTQAVRDRLPQARFGIEYGLDFAHEPGYRHDWEILPETDRAGRPIPVASRMELAGLIERPAIKLLIKTPIGPPDEFMDEVEDLIGGQVTVTRSGSSALVEISAAGVTKASGLAILADQHGIARADVAAVGDMPNDVPMLRWAGHSFAVANAHPSAKAAAGRVIESNDDDAVAILIETLLRDHEPRP